MYTFFYVPIAEESHEQLLCKKSIISPEDVLTLPKITEGTFCY